jgi:hypothetical protein
MELNRRDKLEEFRDGLMDLAEKAQAYSREYKDVKDVRCYYEGQRDGFCHSAELLTDFIGENF